MINNQDDEEAQTTLYYPMAILGLMCLALLVTIVTWIVMIVKSCQKKGKYEDDELTLSDNDEYNGKEQKKKRKE